MFAIIGIGPNEVEITAMVCASKEEAEEEMALRGVIPGENIRGCEEGRKIGEKFFVSYYGGCGGAYRYIIREISFGVPFAKWDLD